MDHPNYHCFLGCLEVVAKFMASFGVDRSVDFVTDTESFDVRARALLGAFRGWQWPERHLVGDVDPRDGQTALPLQSADMISWLLRTELSRPGVKLREETLLDVVPPVVRVTFTEKMLIGCMETYHARLQELDPTGRLLGRARSLRGH